MKAGFAFLFLLIFSLKGVAQFEQPKKTLKIAPAANPSGQIAPTTSKSITYPSIFDKKDKLVENVSLLKKKEEPEKSIMEKEQFVDPSKQYTDKMNDMMKREGNTSVVNNEDVFLGEFIVTTIKLSISCRDFGAIDGDNVSIWLNGKIVIPAIYLESGMKQYSLELTQGSNVVQIEALNTGELFPNTGQFAFFDANGKLVTNQQWVLNTGYKAIVRIRKIKGLEETVELKEDK
jgi:hypothetical protein